MFTSPQTSINQWTKIKDAALEKELQEQYSNDKRLDNLSLSFQIKGGVAQVEGQIDSWEEQATVRNVFAQHNGLFAVWDLLTVAGKNPDVADVGCGMTKQTPQATGIDKMQLSGIDVVTDLENPLPLPDNSFDVIFAVHVIEHIHHLVELMNELNRILRPHGVLHIITPLWSAHTALADPTHVRLLNSQTLKYFCERKPTVAPWKPLKTALSQDSIFADLQPLDPQEVIQEEDIARWFY